MFLLNIRIRVLTSRLSRDMMLLSFGEGVFDPFDLRHLKFVAKELAVA
jgi:hypothetical protein